MQRPNPMLATAHSAGESCSCLQLPPKQAHTVWGPHNKSMLKNAAVQTVIASCGTPQTHNGAATANTTQIIQLEYKQEPAQHPDRQLAAALIGQQADTHAWQAGGSSVGFHAMMLDLDDGGERDD